MTFDPEQYLPQPNPWFETEITYKGIGHAEFAQPKGWIKGPVEIHIDETGNATVAMTEINDFYCEEPLGTQSKRDDLTWLLNGRRPEIGAWTTHIFGLDPENICLSFKVNDIETECGKGTFEVLDKRILYTLLGVMWGQDIIHFFIGQSQFSIEGNPRAKYWVIPLSNFIMSRPPLMSQHPIFRHPLRSYLSPDIPNSLSTEEKQTALSIAQSKNNLIVFKYGKGLAFIEPLIDFDKRKEKLKRCEACNLITSLMIGRVGGRSIEVKETEEWLPIDHIHLLSLASGSLVGIPWIEFRDSQGQLVKRIHDTRLWQSDFQPGHEALRVDSINTLLSNAPIKLSSGLRTALRLLVKGSLRGLGKEDNLSFLFRALDTLCFEYKTYKSIPPEEPLFLNQQNKELVKKILRSTRQEILRLSDDMNQTKALQKIADRVSDSSNINNSRMSNFGEAVVFLLEKYGLNDSKIVEKHHQIWGHKEWHKKLSEYRGRILHDNYFMFSDGTHNIEELAFFMRHLHDILLRIILKSLNHEGEYKSPVTRNYEKLDWVKTDTSASRLGYK